MFTPKCSKGKEASDEMTTWNVMRNSFRNPSDIANQIALLIFAKGEMKMKLSFTKSWTVILAVLALAFSAIGVTPAHAAGIVVNSLLDIPAVDSNCTLREAIQNANDDALTNADCLVAGSGADTITFSVSGTIPLSSALPNITDVAGLAVDGAGQTVTISGGHIVQVFLVGHLACSSP